MEVLYEDDHLIAINKPHGLFVHRTALDKDATIFAVQCVRDLIGQRVYPVHRLDRKTSGVLVLAKSKSVQSLMNEMFRERQVMKKYLAIVRGYTDDNGTIDYVLKTDKGKAQDALTHYRTIKRTEIQISSGRFETSRYSMVELNPVTGRMHQLRRHMSHIFHPIIGDRPHGCNKQNRFFLAQFEMGTMMLHASEISFAHPISGLTVHIQGEIHSEFERMIRELGFDRRLI
ncbi:MAG: pseudouridylate synthase [Saprospiraceae bacterium]|nr:pseudouridylate synthase [Saprospiraceae bacterium]MBK8669170.1 pseudouridylate synthase [Saprospiraceae bacterium]